MSLRFPLIAALALALSLAMAGSEGRVSASAGSQAAGGTIFYSQLGGQFGIGGWSVSASGGQPTQIETGVSPTFHIWDVSRDGSKLLIASSGASIWVVNSDGSGAQHVADGADATWSPDGERFAYRCGEEQNAICAIDGDGSNNQVVYDPVDDEQLGDLDWGPNDKIVFGSCCRDDDFQGLAVINSNGTGRTNIIDNVHPESAPEWSPDGDEILYTNFEGIHVLSAGGTFVRTVTADVLATEAAWSPDGSQVVYNNSSGLLISDADGTGAHPLPGTSGARQPIWVGEPGLVHSVEFTQAIQEWQSLPELKSDLEGDGQPPVPLVAGKTTAIRVYFNELSEERTFVVDSNVSDTDVQTTQYAGCAPEDTRRGEDICTSADFFFAPPEGEWTADIFIKDTNGAVLEEHSFDFTTPKAPGLVLVAVSVCDSLEDGTWLCGDTRTLDANVRLLRRMAPTHEVRAMETNHYIRREFTGSGDEEGEAWWQLVLDDLRALSGRFPDDLVVPGERRMYVGVVREDGPDGLSGQAELGGIVMTSRERTFSLGREDTQDTVTHEAVHVLGVEHTNSGAPDAEEAPGCFAIAEAEGSDWPYADNFLRSGAAPGDIEVGFNAFESDVLPGDEIFEISGYCGPNWISPRTSRRMLQGLSAPLLGSGGVATPQGTAGDFWQVSGRIEDGVATFNPLFEFASESSTTSGEGDYRVEVRDASEGVLFTRHFTPSESGVKPEPGFDPTDPPPAFSQMIPVQVGAASIAVIGPGDAFLGEVELTGTAPVVTFNQLPTPAVSGAHTISWTITDADSADHTAWIEYSQDNGATWNAIAVGLEMASLQVDFDSLPGGANAILRVTVSDGVNTGSATTAPFGVAEKGPEAIILGPADGAVYGEGQAVVFEAIADDPDDGTLGGAAVTWSSSRDGTLGQGANLAVYDLTVGTHTITLTARDSDNEAATSTVQVSIVAGEGPDVDVGDVNCSGYADPEDALSLLLHLGGLASGACEAIGQGDPVFGDADCSGTVGPNDVVAVLRFAARLRTTIAPECLPFGL